MALKIIDNKLVGTIDNLEEKLNGEIPITREELLVLVNSWGRKYTLWTKVSNNKEIFIYKCNKSKKPYDLSKLNVSQITNMESIFFTSNFNDIHSTNGIGLHEGDISKWDVSNVTNMVNMFREAHNFNFNIGNWNIGNVENLSYMFCKAINFNQNLNNWDTSKVTNMCSMFSHSKNFNGNISKWNLDKVEYCDSMFYNAKKFEKKYNNEEPFPINTNEIKEWFNLNRDKMNEIDIKEKHGEEINNFFSNIDLKKYNEINKE